MDFRSNNSMGFKLNFFYDFLIQNFLWCFNSNFSIGFWAKFFFCDCWQSAFQYYTILQIHAFLKKTTKIGKLCCPQNFDNVPFSIHNASKSTCPF